MTTTLAPEVTETDRVLASMFTENTGRHMLDSGGAYGRNWERNQGREVEDFVASPAVWFDGHEDSVWPILSTFHFLRDRLEYDPTMQRRFELWVALRDEPDDPWLVEAEAFAEAWHDRTWRYEDVRTYNSYNGDSFLSQVIQWVQFDRDGETYAVLQVHGGCDVRGGYTRPRVFRMTAGTYGLHVEDVEVWCPKVVEPAVAVQEALVGEPAEVLSPDTCAQHAWSFTYATGELRAYNHDTYEDLYGKDVEEFTPVWRDNEAVCRGCGTPVSGALGYYEG